MGSFFKDSHQSQQEYRKFGQFLAPTKTKVFETKYKTECYKIEILAITKNCAVRPWKRNPVTNCSERIDLTSDKNLHL